MRAPSAVEFMLLNSQIVQEVQALVKKNGRGWASEKLLSYFDRLNDLSKKSSEARVEKEAAREKRRNKVLNRPEWLLKMVSGIAEGKDYSVYLEGTTYVVLHRKGGHCWSGIGMPATYYPSVYSLAQRGTKRWDGKWRDLHEGRLTKEAKEKIKAALEAEDGMAERSQGSEA